MATTKVSKIPRKRQRSSIKNKIPKVFRVSREIWYRGRNNAELLNPTGRMCCLGFVCLQCGLKKEDIIAVATPSGLGTEEAKRLEGFLVRKGEGTESWDDTLLTDKATMINDDSEITDKVRETRLRKLFAKAGKKMVFVP